MSDLTEALAQSVDGPARQTHAARRRSAQVLHGTLWLLARFPGDVLDDGEPQTPASGPETALSRPDSPELPTGTTGNEETAL